MHNDANLYATAMPDTEFTLTRNAFGRLVLTLDDGTAHEGVVPVRAFPIARRTTASA